MFGIRASLEESRYAVAGRLDHGVEIRLYAPRRAAETDLDREGARGDADAFRRLFSYISGKNRADGRVAMTAPVEKGRRVAMTVPVQSGPGEGVQEGVREETGEGAGAPVMRFFLPEAVASDPPEPSDPRVRLVAVPEQRLAVLRFSGRAGRKARAARQAELLQALTAAGHTPRGAPFFMGYDPPFTLPFLRRNEVAVVVE